MRTFCRYFACLTASAFAVLPSAPAVAADAKCVAGESMTFRPGDASRNTVLEAGDSNAILNWLYQGGAQPNLEAADVDQNQQVDMADAVGILNYLYNGGPPPALGTQMVPSCQQVYAATFGYLQSTVALTSAERTTISNDSRYTYLRNKVLLHNLNPDLNLGYADTIHRGNGTVKIYVVPCVYYYDPSKILGAILMHEPGNSSKLATALVAGNAPQDPHFILYGTNGDKVKMEFNPAHKFLGHSMLATGAGGTVSWEAFKDWLNSDSGAEDLPWWLDLLCGIACADALLGTHNPLSISGCIHCVGLYVASCVPTNPT